MERQLKPENGLSVRVCRSNREVTAADIRRAHKAAIDWLLRDGVTDFKAAQQSYESGIGNHGAMSWELAQVAANYALNKSHPDDSAYCEISAETIQ